MSNNEPACMKVHAKHNIIRNDCLIQYNLKKIELQKKSKILTDKVVMSHKAIFEVFPKEIFEFIKSHVFTQGSKIENELIRIERVIQYKMKHLMINRIDDLLIHQNIQWDNDDN
jgi:hypothetical protein